jgi:hypothetical protein
VHGRYKKTDKNLIRKINEDGPGSNYRTIDPKPISFFHDDRVEVDIYPTGWGDHGVQVTCPTLSYDSGLRRFTDEEQATLWARNQYSDLVSKLGSDEGILEAVLYRLLNHAS